MDITFKYQNAITKIGTMKNILLCSFLLSFLFLNAQQNHQVNDPNAQQRNVDNFNSISVRGPFTVFFSKGSNSAVAVSAGSNYIRDKIETKVVGSQLLVKLAERDISDVFKNQHLKLYVSSPNLSEVECSGSVDFVIVDVLKSDALQLNFSGSCDINGKIEANRLNANFSGASDLDITGAVKHATIILSGASDCDALELKAGEADVKASGASTIRIHAVESLKAVATGASKVIYSGEPSKIDRSSSGASTVRKLESTD